MLITAHSGCDGTPDNSLEYIRHAVTLPVDALEIDVRKTSDGTLVLSHDEILPDGSNVLCTLDEAFALIAPTDLAVNCDLKPAGLEKAVMDLAEKHGLLQRLIFSGTISTAIRQEQPEIFEKVQIYINCEELVSEIYDRFRAGGFPEDELLLRSLRTCAEKGFHVLNLYYKLCTPAVVELAHELGVGLSAWTVNEEADIKKLLPCGLHNMTSRKPGLVRQLAEEAGIPATQTKR